MLHLSMSQKMVRVQIPLGVNGSYSGKHRGRKSREKAGMTGPECSSRIFQPQAHEYLGRFKASKQVSQIQWQRTNPVAGLGLLGGAFWLGFPFGDVQLARQLAPGAPLPVQRKALMFRAPGGGRFWEVQQAFKGNPATHFRSEQMLFWSGSSSTEWTWKVVCRFRAFGSLGHEHELVLDGELGSRRLAVVSSFGGSCVSTAG